MFDTFFAPQALPFAIALTVTAGLFFLEIISALLGASIIGAGAEGPNIDMDTDFDLSAEVDGAVEASADSLDFDSDIDTASGWLGWTGLRDVPLLIWLVSFLTMFGLGGLILQSLAAQLLGAPLTATTAGIIILLPAVGVTRVIANHVALIMPKTETSALRTRFLGGHSGIITQGTAQRGRPAEAKIKDRHGNTHYLRVEPLDDTASFAQGSNVTIIRKTGDRFFVI